MQRAHVWAGRNEQLVTAREEKGPEWSQEHLADQVGVHRVTVQRWEMGTSFPRPRHLRKLCKVLEKSATALGFGEEPRQEANTPPEEAHEADTLAETARAGETQASEVTEDLAETVRAEEPKEPELPTGEEYQYHRESSLVLRLFLCVKNYPRSSKARYHELQVLIALELRDNQMDTHELSRREALKFVAVMPVEVCGLSVLKPVFKESPDEILLLCGAGLTACWGLRKTQDITFAAQTAAKYIPTLKEITVIGSRQQRKEAAELLFQSFLLLATHSYVVQIGAPNAVAYGKQAEIYANMAENPLLRIIALRSQSVAYEYTGDWKSALDTGLEAKGLLETTKNMPIPLLIESYVRSGLANYQAFFGLKDDAEISLKQAHAAFEAQPQGESAPIWVNFSIGDLHLNSGKVQMHFGLYKDAIALFQKVDTDYAHDASTPFATRIEVIINQIIAEASRNDQSPNMDWCITNWKRSLNHARALQSTRKENRVAEAHAAMLRLWPEEKDVTDLGVHLIGQKPPAS
jgi:transcriptional regulator with XRE-family HTH domain